MQRLDAAQDRRSLTTEELQLRKELKYKTLGLSSLARTIARQRSSFWRKVMLTPASFSYMFATGTERTLCTRLLTRAPQSPMRTKSGL